MRLIDADKLIEQLREVDDEIVKGCIGVIETQPTAYDVEAVVKGIVAVHNRTCTEEIDCKGWNCDECFENRVREIVRGK